ncbi:MAG: transcription termination factor NusA [Planctomycetia bacterium]|nr:transcription termination factor NusA [Planctomycetia bacterium]
MNPAELLKLVDAIHREKNIDKEIVFEGIEAAFASALRKHHGEEIEIKVTVDRQTGVIKAVVGGTELSSEEVVGRIGAQTAKQVMIQKIREAERDSLFDEYSAERGQLVTGIVQRCEGGTATVSLNNTEAILPRSEQIPGESHHVGERVRATIYEVRKQGSRVKVVLSRIRAELVQRLFEQEIPEIADGVIVIRAIAREPGYRTKVAVSSTDQRVDCVGACVGVRGNRIKNIVDELANERIDIVRWSDDMQALIPNALQPAEVDEVILCSMLGRAIVLVREDQLSLAIGKRGQNVRLGSKLCGWDVEIMTREELDEAIERAVGGFSQIEGVTPELSERLVGEGFLSYDDLSIIETKDLTEMGGLTEEQVEKVRDVAEALGAEQEALADQRRRERQAEAAAAAAASAAAASAATEPAAAQSENGQPPAAPTGEPGATEPEPAAQPTTAGTGIAESVAESSSGDAAAAAGPPAGPTDDPADDPADGPPPAAPADAADAAEGNDEPTGGATAGS